MEPRNKIGRMDPTDFDPDGKKGAKRTDDSKTIGNAPMVATTSTLTIVGAVLALVVLVGGKTKGNGKKGKKGDKKKKKGEKVSKNEFLIKIS